jgi:hypothetical protein
MHVQMMSIPLYAGFSPSRWRQIIDVMLNKKEADHRVHCLRIVALQESDFNQCNRMSIGRPLLHALEDNKDIPDIQQGSRPSKLCHSAILNKQLTFNIHQGLKKPMVYIKNDAMSCYDCIANPLVLTFLQILGVHQNTTESLASTWEATYHKIKTLYGISQAQYTNTIGELLYGPGQGSTIGPILWLLCFLLISLSLSSTAPRITLTTTTKDRETSYVGEAFVDDTGLGTNLIDGTNATPAFIQVSRNLRTLSQEWERLLFSTGGTLNLQKCLWFLLSWDWKQGKAKLQSITDTPCALTLTSGNNPEEITIQRIEPTDTFPTLLLFLSPSGNCKESMNVLLEIAL